MPMFRKKNYQLDVSIENVLDDIDHIFQIFDFVEWIQLVGGEIFLYKDLDKIFDYLLRYRQKFSKLILMTNATVRPKKREIDLLRQYGEQCQIMLSDYGEYSSAIQELITCYQENAIPYTVKKYYGDLQYYDGWIDNNQFLAFDGTEEQLFESIQHCPQIHMQNMHCMQGKLYMCSNALFISELGVVQAKNGDFVDLNDDTVSIEKKQETIRQFYHKSAAACSVCAFKEAKTAKRYPAAVQIGEMERESK